ncbi:tRNA (adenine(22)-N(1))-methyltransferase [Paenibacillaceae bacterium WGS1546]|uniref:tRNA (adenine(22)-N(1))-methyltransferase n=1 Tax=Cohnella sp. WGS1546 TaxID=3366810 RepID=UPI00372D3BF7
MMETKDDAYGLKLSRRLAALAEWVPQGARFADIGTDHALLPVYLALQGTIAFAVAGDVNEGPVNAAKRQVAEKGLQDKVSVRLGDGLSVLRPGEADTVAIAGMGGSLMVKILDRGGERLTGVRTLVLSPHVAEDAVRRWLAEHDFVLEDERLIEEEGVIYTLMKAARASDPAEATKRNAALYDGCAAAAGSGRIPLQLLLEMGPLLLRKPSDAFYRKWEQEIAKRERVILQLRRAVAPEAAEKAQEWEQDVKEIREVLACLRGEKRSYN